MDPGFLAECVDALAVRPDLIVVHPRPRLIDDDGAPLTIGPGGEVRDRAGNRHHPMEPPHLAEGPSPAARFAEALRRMNWCLALFGVIRRDALARTNLLGGYYEADRVLLGELARLGPFLQLDRPLMVKRCHGGVSVLKGFADKARMMDPTLHPLLPGMRLRAGYLRALGVGHLPAAEQMACLGTVARLFLRNALTHKLKLKWALARGYAA